MPEPDPDLSLVRALQADDDRALDELMGKYKGPIYALIFRSVGNEALAQDLLQEAFVRCYFGIGKFKPKAKFVTWLYAIAINLCRDHARSRRHKESMLTDSFGEISEMEKLTGGHERSVLPDKELERRETLEALESAIGQLPHDLKTAFIMFSIEGRSQADCAELLGVSPKAVETRVYRAKKVLQDRLGAVADI